MTTAEIKQSATGATTAEHRSSGTGADNPALLGLPALITGSLSLVLYLTDFRSAGNSLAASLPVMVLSSGVLSMIATVWAARIGQGHFAAVWGLFSTFWFSFSALTLGLGHDWYGDLANLEQRNAHASFVFAWLIVLTAFTLTTLRLPKSYTILFVGIDLVLLGMFLSIIQAAANPQAGDPAVLTAANLGMFLFIGFSAWIFAGAMNEATGGRPFRLGRPFVKR
ncbi:MULTISPECIES: GPR1/FUN34/YaaH family transporter [Actinosynnema]|uniref:GPR1/FUN34/yaaH family protein n=1 Tax=Actinosynnema pretiosum TaxID=42197 RepID=A0A290Z7N2_9PSEU|nr:GPR1/FUN34/YaaH family transporter [Actinosynnema pretiosum]ATE55006.1 hypothetical protein CNX65_18355 [Actinosynnema pretiosum]